MRNPNSAADAPIRFNSQLDLERAALTFAERRRARIDDVLDPLTAARLYACLSTEVPWRLTYNARKECVYVDAAALEEMGDRKQHELVHAILSRAQDGFQYLFRSYPMVTAYLRHEDPDLFLHRVFEWLNDSHTLDVLRKITGIDTIRKADAQATLYRPGHFLKQHDDNNRGDEHRRVAYVLQMTRGWCADWGGNLQFVTAGGEVEETWMPRFNSLALFEVPTPHFVGYVAPFATQPRYAITGWLCDAPEQTSSSGDGLG